MKIAFLTDTYWPRVNGVTVSTSIFIKQLKLLGHEVRLWAPDYSTKATPIAHGPDEGVLRFRSVKVFFSPEDRLPNPRYRRQLYEQMDFFGPDLIHVQTEVSSWLIGPYARKRKVPVVQTCHTYFEQYIAFYFPIVPAPISQAYARWLTRRLVKSADALVAPSQAMKAVIESYGIQIPVTVVPTGIDEDDFQAMDKEQERSDSRWLNRFPALRNRPLLLCVGRIALEKNVDFLLEAAARIRVGEPKVALLLAGDGPYLTEFQGKIVQRGLADTIFCLGYVNRNDLRHLYALADVFTFASVTETQGLVTIEAMMSGTPAVAIGKMGTQEVMGGDHGGFMVKEDPEAFAQAVLKLLQDPELYRQKSAEALAHSQEWTAKKMARKLEALYTRVLTDSLVQ